MRVSTKYSYVYDDLLIIVVITSTLSQHVLYRESMVIVRNQRWDFSGNICYGIPWAQNSKFYNKCFFVWHEN